MAACILLSHVYVRHDQHYKLKQIEFTIKHYRLHNPNSYIILTGHGLQPTNLTIEICDFVDWRNTIIEEELEKGHPYLVNVGIDHAINQKFTHLFKCRSDGVILRDNITQYCSELIKDKNILLTQQTKFSQIHAGDLFMYGDIDYIKKCWNIGTWYPTTSGLISFARNIYNNQNHLTWKECLKKYAEFVDIYQIKWIDFRANWTELQSKLENILINKLENYERFLWGSREEWHIFDTNGNMIQRIEGIISKNEWDK